MIIGSFQNLNKLPNDIEKNLIIIPKIIFATQSGRWIPILSPITKLISKKTSKKSDRKQNPVQIVSILAPQGNNMDTQQYYQLKNYILNNKLPSTLNNNQQKRLQSQSKFFEVKNNQLYKKDRRRKT